jgi:hypothetical protein
MEKFNKLSAIAAPIPRVPPVTTATPKTIPLNRHRQASLH